MRDLQPFRSSLLFWRFVGTTLGLGPLLGSEALGCIEGTSSKTAEIVSSATSACTAQSKTASYVGESGCDKSDSLSMEIGSTFRSSNSPSRPTVILGAIANSS